MIAAGLLCLLAACASTPVHSAYPPILFVHGNGDNAAIWMSTIWRYESNGWPRERLHALDLPNPMARDDDATPQEGRSSTEDYRRFIAAEVERVLAATGAKQVVLIGSSRGANAIRNYIENDAGRRTVSHAIIAGGTSHGVWADAAIRPRNEFNGAGPFLSGLNAPKGPNGDEVTPGPRWMTLRSDHEDKYSQPYGTWLGMPDMQTHVTFDGPALKGALNVVLPGLDHREVAFHPKAFEKSFEFITGHPPAVLEPVPESRVTLDGVVSGYPASGPTNLPLTGAGIEVFAVNGDTGARLGAALVDKIAGADGHWGPMTTDPRTPLEFVITASGYATTHIYHPPFVRSSAVVDLRAELMPDANRDAECVVTLMRTQGYFGLPRDRVELAGIVPAPGIPVGVPGAYASTAKLHDCEGRSVTGRFNGHVITGIARAVKNNHIVQLELHD
ncbi:MAG: alpha/beta fold hydrolase [Steroidobacteraceae bacterium]